MMRKRIRMPDLERLVRKPAQPGTQWVVYTVPILDPETDGLIGHLWAARPFGVGVWADVSTRRKEIFFTTWREAFDFADEKARTIA